MARVLTIIVTFNGMKWLAKCVDSVKSSTVSSDIMFIDNCSTDGTREYLQSLRNDSDIFVHLSDQNLGFAKGNNIGFRKAIADGYDYVYLLNQDAWVEKDTFSKLIGCLESVGTKRYGIVSPMQMKANLQEMDEQFRKQCSKAVTMAHGEIADVGFVMAAHWMISISCLKTVGGFSPVFPHYGEDNNFIDRALYHGYNAGICKSAIAVHDRDSRPRPKAYRMMLKKIHAARIVCDPRKSPLLTMIGTPFWMLGMGIYHKSWDMICGILPHIGRYPEFLSARKASMKMGQFLG